jgi:hypothetical protein
MTMRQRKVKQASRREFQYQIRRKRLAAVGRKKDRSLEARFYTLLGLLESRLTSAGALFGGENRRTLLHG